MRIWLIIFILLTSSVCYGQYTGGFQDFGPDRAYSILTQSGKFTKASGALGASDVNVQLALQSYNASGSTVKKIENCNVNTDDFCFQFQSNTLSLFVNGTAQVEF